MSTITVKGQVTVPKPIRDALGLTPGSRVDFDLDEQGRVVLRRAEPATRRRRDRFEAARGKADVRWRTDDLMALLRTDE
ncbi:AbrB/MazE/SpoVT family DNA-binding domain-containing protein [Ottowia testudinis]|uniref:Type II toxin-antitoxin system PrlF family antitoxin n=1 Tax=Ottowia testudinis TaxID=2816950 RepID=A0A975CFZ4_9BURK|nr:type II toxin-antitoxin system PrlF family antitoxin [Ottowia testudinis]QTD45081.1 type II toxin-antitoxin system PrlF family antitoxin [Ottowia testudinis]